MFLWPKINAHPFESWVTSESGLQTLYSHEVHAQLLSSLAYPYRLQKPN